LLDARHNHQRAARAELHTRACCNFRWLHDAPPVQECAEARIGVNQHAAPVLEAKLGVLARDHRPFGLVENDVALCWVATDFNSRVFVGALRGNGLTIALFYQNDFHVGYLKFNKTRKEYRQD
jgi:hypothetical protein